MPGNGLGAPKEVGPRPTDTQLARIAALLNAGGAG
jgi:hypothetical protein